MLYEKLQPAADDSAEGNLVRAVLDRVQYVRDGANPYSLGATALVEVVQDGETENITALNGVSLNASATWRPRTDVHDSTGVVIVGQVTSHVLAKARIRVTVTGGGSGTGAFLITFSR